MHGVAMEVALEDLTPEHGYVGQPSQVEIMSACERHLGAAQGDGVVALIVRDAETNTSTLVVVLADSSDYKPLPTVLGAMLWQGMEASRVTMKTEAFFLRWRAGSTDYEGGAASEEDLLVKAVRSRQAAENEAARRALLPAGLADVRRITAAGRTIYEA